MMLMAVATILLLIVGAVCVAVVDLALGPHNDNFPCASPLMHWAMRIYALLLFNYAASLGSGLLRGVPQAISWPALLMLAGLATLHVIVLVLLMKSRLPAGAWGRLQMRMELSKRKPG